jgi:hypothetical protein
LLVKSLRPFLLPLLAFILFALALAAFASLNYSWAGWGYAECYPGCFCEAFRPGGIVQPLSSWSNMFYIAAGLLILGSLSLPQKPVILPALVRRGPGSGAKDLSDDGETLRFPSHSFGVLRAGAQGDNQSGNNLLSSSRAYAAGFGIAVILIGVTSLFFHVSLTQVGRWFDYMGMYAFAGFALLYSLARLFRWKGRTFAGAYVLLLGTLGALWVYAPALRRPALGGLILAIILVEAFAHWRRRPFPIRTGWLVAALACFVAAYAVNMADEAGPLCAPDSLWQWHAVWHLLTAASTLLLYVYYRSERESRTQD